MGSSSSHQQPTEEQEKKCRQRREVVTEIVNTEDSYFSCLDIVARVYLAPLEEALGQNKPIITQDEVTAVFSNIREIHQLHSRLSTELKEAQGGSENGPFAHVLAKHIPSFKIYTEYVNNFNNSLATLSQSQRKKAFQQFLSEANRHPDCRGRDLPTFLINPIQRLPRYILLLQELQKLTPPKHKDYKNITRALADVKQMTEFINKEKQVAEMCQRLLQIQESFTDEISLISKERQLVQEGDFSYRNNNKGTKRAFKLNLHFFLFNDMLLLGRPRSAVGRVSSLITGSDASWQMTAHAPLSRVDVQDQPDTKDEQFCILLLIDNKEYVLKFSSQQEKEACMTLFFTTKSKSHRVKYVDITVSSSSSTISPRKKTKEDQKNSRKGKGKAEEPPPEGIASTIKSAFSSLSTLGQSTDTKGKTKKK